MENKKIILGVIVAVCVSIVGVVVFALNTDPIKNTTINYDVGNNSSIDDLTQSANENNSSSSNTNNSSESSISTTYSESSDSETHEGVSQKQAEQRASEEIKGKDYILIGDPIWRSQDKMWKVPLFNKDNNNQYFGDVFIYCDSGKITKVVPYF